FFFFQAEDGIRDRNVTGVQTCALPISRLKRMAARYGRWFTITPDEVASASVWFQRYGAAAVFFGRMVPTIRTVISLPAGIVRMEIGRASCRERVWRAGGVVRQQNGDAT